MEIFNLTNIAKEILSALSNKTKIFSDGTSALATDSKDFARVRIVGATYEYDGIAVIGSLEASPVWKVKRTTVATPFTTVWAGAGKFDQIMSNYATLVYA